MPVLRSLRPPSGVARLQAITGWDYRSRELTAFQASLANLILPFDQLFRPDLCFRSGTASWQPERRQRYSPLVARAMIFSG
jgi:hypothetical protein